jgi:hypothetical protein
VRPDHEYRPLIEEEEEFRITDLVPDYEEQKSRVATAKNSYHRVRDEEGPGEVFTTEATEGDPPVGEQPDDGQSISTLEAVDIGPGWARFEEDKRSWGPPTKAG